MVRKFQHWRLLSLGAWFFYFLRLYISACVHRTGVVAWHGRRDLTVKLAGDAFVAALRFF